MPEDYSAFTPVEQPESTQDTTQFTPVDPVVDTTQFTPVEANKTEPQENVDLRDYGRGSTNSHPWEDWGMSLDEWNKLPQTERTAKTFGWWMNKPVSGAVTNESMGNIESTLMSPIAAIPRIPEPSQSTIDAWGQAATELGMPHLAGAARIIPQAATAATNQIAIPLANFAQSPAMPLTILTGGAGAIGRAAVTGTFLGQTLKQGIEQFPQHVQDLTNTSLSDQQRLNALGGIVNETVLPPLILHGGMHGQPPVTEGEAALANANAMTKALQGEQLSGFTDPITGEPITKAKAIELGLSKEIPTSPEYAWTTLRPQRGMPDQQAVAEPLTLAEPAPVPEQVEVPEPMAVPESPVVPEPPTVPEPREVGQPTSSTQQEQAPPTRLADFNRAIGRVSSMIPSAAPLYVPAPQTPITNQINSAKAGFEGVTQLNKMASDVALGKPAEEPAQPPATYAGHMDGFGNLPGFDLYNLNVDLPGHPKNSTVSEHTLRDNNIDPSQILKTSTQESNAIRQQEPTEMDVRQQDGDGQGVGGQDTLVQGPTGARQPGEQQDLAGAEAQGGAGAPKPATRGFIGSTDAFKNAEERIRTKMREGNVNMNMSPSDFWSYMVYGAGKMEEGLINSAEWIAHMAALVPAELKPHLQGMYQYAREIMEAATQPTSGKNAQTDLDRMERGLPPAHLAISRAFEESSKLAEKKEADNPGYTDKLTAELLNHPRAAQDYETAALLHKKVELENMQDKAMKEALKPGLSGDELGRAINDAADLHNALLDNYTALRESGTELGRGMNIRKMLENEDYSLEHMQVKKEAAGVGLKLTDEQKAARKVATSKIFDRITQGNEAIEKHAADLDEKKSQKAADDSIANIKVDLAAEAMPPKIRQLANRIIAKIDAEADTARVELSKYFGSAHAMIAPDPAVVVNLAKVMASHVAHGLDKVASSSQLLATYGKGVLAFIDRAWEVANRLVDSNAPENKTAFRHAIKAVRVSAEKKADIVAAMKDGFEKGRKVQEMGRYANILERMVVESGVEGREEVTDAVHKILVEEVDPTITRREARDAMSHYGQYQKLDKDAIKAKIRQNHGEMQNLSKMEDLEAGQNPSKTGKQRPEKGDDWRHLEAQVNEAKRRSGLRSDDPETQLKSALDTIETRLKNQISDLNYQIVNRAKIVKDRTKVVEDEETTRLRAQVAELKTQFNAIFNTPEMTDANRLKAAERIADRQITELERQIRMREPFEPGRKAPVTSEALEAKKARIEALKHERQMIRDQLQPPPEAKSPEEREIELKERQLANLEEAVRTETVFSKGKKPRTEIQSTRLDQLNANIKATKERIAAMREALQPREYKTRDEIGNQIYRARAAHQLADYRDKLARGDFSPRQKPAPIELDKESLALQAEVLRAKNDYNRGLLADRMANRDTWEKIADVVPRFRRAAILSSLGILKKLSSAAVLRMGLTPMEEIARSGLRHLPIIRGVAEKAPRYGRGFMWDAEKAALMDPVNHGLRDMWDIIRTGQTSRDVLYGKGHDLATGEYPILHSVLEFPGRTHGVLKAPVKGSEEARAEVQRFAHEDRQGKNMADLTDKEKFAIRQKAYNNGLAAIFLQDNILASGVNRLAGHFQSVNPITGRTRVAGKLFSVATRTMLPIVKVPSNVVAETMEWALGSVFGSLDIAYDTKLKMGGWGNLTKAMMKADTAKIGAALKDAISSMSDDEADMVMRMLGRGLLGPAILAVGCMYYKNIGGYYEQHEKRFPGEIQPEKFKIGKVTLSGRVVHHPVTGLLDFAATIMRLKDRMVPYEGKRGVASAFGSAAWDMLFQTPIFREMLEMDKLNDPATRGDFLGDLEKSFVVPRGIQELAEWRDQNSSGDTIRRETKGWIGPIQSGIPIWRNQLPQKPPAGSSKSTGFKTPRIPKH